MSYFLNAVLPPQGTYFVVAIKNGKVKQVHASSIEAINDFANQAPSRGCDAYFALASFKDSSARTTANSDLKKAFYLDIDCGPNKDYPDALSARTALDAFLESTGLPDPMIVASGFGLHVYWPLVDAVVTDSWVPVAKALKQLCVEHGLKADPSVTADAARILRIPGTKNFKNGTPRDVLMVQDANPITFGDFAKLMPVPPSTTFLDAAKQLTGASDDPASTITGPMPTWNFKRIAEASLRDAGCNQIKFAIENAATLPEPMWRAALSVAWCCEDRDEAILDISRAHPQFTEANTIKKAKETSGAWHCATYREHFPAQCQGCKQKVNNPLAFGKIVHADAADDGVYKVESSYVVSNTGEAQTITVHEEIPEYPFPDFRGRQGGVFRRQRDEDGNETEVMIYDRDLYIAGRAYDSEEHGEGGGEIYTIKTILPHDGVRVIVMAASDIMSKDKLVQGLAREGVFVHGTKQVEAVLGYLVSSMRMLRDKNVADFTRSQMGWTPGNKSFVVGNVEYDANGSRLAPPCSGTRQLAECFRPMGTLEEWRKAANFYARPGQEAKAFALFAAFGSPLLSMFDSATIRGALINLISTESGTGKTTCLLMLNSIWGNPSGLLMQQQDTPLAKFQRLGMLNSIHATVDEITTMPEKDLSAFMFATTTGRGRHRMESQSNRLRINNTSWCNITFASSNRSIMDLLASMQSAAEGEKRRLIEIYVHPTKEEKLLVDEIFRKIVHNYGHAGTIFIQYTLKHYDAVKAQLLEMQVQIDRELKLDSADRYYSALLAALFVAGSIANKLGLIDIPPEDHTACVQALGMYLAENTNGALAVHNAPAAGGLPTAPNMLPRGPLRYRYELDTKLIWIPSRDFNVFLTEQRLNIAQTIKGMASAGVLKVWQEKDGTSYTRPKRVAAGMVANMAVPSVRCYCFDGSKIASLPDAFGSTNSP